MDKMAFECRVGTLLWESGLQVMRIKGAICLADSPNVYELQGYKYRTTEGWTISLS